MDGPFLLAHPEGVVEEGGWKGVHHGETSLHQGSTQSWLWGV